nr:hypothetical protein [Tanacetum cinerariifolium]
MSSLFADTHNVVAILEKSDAAKGFEQIIDFLNGSYIHYALTVNPYIYISCIKQFWNTASVKRSDDVTRLQALVDRKKIVISEDIIREILQLDDAKGVVCLPNEKIFAGLAQMGYGKPSTKLTFYKAFFSNTCSGFTCHVENLEHDKAAQKLEIIKLKARVMRLERANKVKYSKLRRLRKVGASKRIESSDDMDDVFNQGRMIDDLDKDEGIDLVVDQVKDADIAKTEGRHDTEQAEKQAEIYHLDLDHPSKVLISAASATIFAAKPSIPAATPTVDKGKCILIETPKPIKKNDQIELDAEYARKLHEEINKDIDWDAAIDHVKQKSKNPQCIKQYQVRCKYEVSVQMEEEDQEVLKSINETPAQKAAKRTKLNEEAQEAKDLKKRLEIVLINNKPRFKIIKADETYQLYINFITLLKNFDREDLKNLWRIVKERFSTLKPTNFSDEYLLTTLKTMFEKPDGQDAVWKSQRSVHGLALNISTFKFYTETIGKCNKTSGLEECATWDGGNSTWGGQGVAFGTVPVWCWCTGECVGDGLFLARRVVNGTVGLVRV